MLYDLSELLDDSMTVVYMRQVKHKQLPVYWVYTICLGAYWVAVHACLSVCLSACLSVRLSVSVD